MIWRIAWRLLAAVAYEPGGSRLEEASAPLKLAALTVYWAAAAAALWPGALVLPLYPAVVALLAPRRRLAPLAVASLIPALFIGAAALALSPYEPLTEPWALRALALAVKAYTASLAAVATFSSTSPLELSSLLHRSPRLHDAVVAAYRSLPLVLGDAAEALAAQRLLGGKPHHAMAGAVLNSLRRAEGLAVTLYARGAWRRGARTPMAPVGVDLLGLALLALASATLAAVALLQS